MSINPNFWSTAIGSFPHIQGTAVCQKLAAILDIPAWPQLPRRSYLESIYIQYSATLPGIVLDQANEKVYFDTSHDITPALEIFYENYLADDLAAFALKNEYAAGFFEMLQVLKDVNVEWAKGQVIGPISFGLTISDQDLRASLYDDLLADAIVKNMAMNARWQIQQLKSVAPNTMLFVDEPYMASFGSAYISLDRGEVIAMLDEVFNAIHQEGALAGVHCCANTDWSVLLNTTVDILNLDAYGYLENLALYPAELSRFLERGGVIAWGIVPNDEHIHQESVANLSQKLLAGMQLIEDKSKARGVTLDVEMLKARSLITSSCGLGSTSVEVAEKVIDTLAEMGRSLRAS